LVAACELLKQCQARTLGALVMIALPGALTTPTAFSRLNLFPELNGRQKVLEQCKIDVVTLLEF